MSELWHGNDDPPPVGTQIEYILDGVEREGTYCKGGYILRGTEQDRLRLIDRMQQVSQWRRVCTPDVSCERQVTNGVTSGEATT